MSNCILMDGKALSNKIRENIKKLVKLNISNNVSLINNIDYYGNEIFNILC